MSSAVNRQSRRRAATFLAIALLLAGCTLLFAPIAQNRISQLCMDGEIAKVEVAKEGIGEDDPGSQGSNTLFEVRQLLEEYNAKVSGGEISISTDPFSFEGAIGSFDALGLENGLVGYIEIPAMECSLPLFLGSTKEHMANGATVVSGSSAPLGEASSNCVIAAHRGYGSAAMFRDIEKLSVGDTINVHTLWEDLTYKVVGTRVIDPSDTTSVGLKQGRDLISLVTCHPYGYNYSRYVVEAERAIQQDVSLTESTGARVGDTETAQLREMSLPEIEDSLRWLGAIVVAVSLIYLAATAIFGKKHKRQNEKQGSR